MVLPIEICPAKPTESLMLKFGLKETYVAMLLDSALNNFDSRKETVNDRLAVTVTGYAERSAGGDGRRERKRGVRGLLLLVKENHFVLSRTYLAPL